MRLTTTLFFLLCCLVCTSQTNANSDGKIRYRVIAIEQNGNAESVSNTDEVEVVPSVYIPNAFSPDNDGINDFFSARAKGLQEFHIEIFDRWGNLVFASNNPQSKWDGRTNNKPVPVGGYVYKATYRTYQSEKTYSKKGTLTLVR